MALLPLHVHQGKSIRTRVRGGGWGGGAHSSERHVAKDLLPKTYNQYAKPQRCFGLHIVGRIILPNCFVLGIFFLPCQISAN